MLARLAGELRTQGRRPFVIPLGASTSTGARGYVDAVAELKPLEDASGADERALRRLRALGLVTRQSHEPLGAFKPIRVKGASLSQAVIEDREDRF